MFHRWLSIAVFSGVLVGCSSDDNNTVDSASLDTAQFEMQIVNATLAQPLSPVAAILHNSDYRAWVDGTEASVAIEQMAEAGNNADLLAEASADTDVFSTTSGDGPVGGGAEAVLSLEAEASGPVYLTMASMLVNTNDAFTGINALLVSDLDVGQSTTIYAPVWDAGTEQNTELAGSIPGPADGGEGFNASRTGDLNRVVFHQGVITRDDGLDTSVLDQSHRFVSPAVKVIVTRTQ